MVDREGGGGGSSAMPDMTDIIARMLESSNQEEKSTTETAMAMSDMVKSFCAAYNASYVADVVEKQVEFQLQKRDGDQSSKRSSSSKGKETPPASEERSKSHTQRLRTLEMKDDGVPKGKSYFLVRTLMKQLISVHLGCHLPWLQIPNNAKNRVEAEIRISFKNGTYLSAEWLKKQMQGIMNHQRSYRRRLMRAYLRDLEPSEPPKRPHSIQKEFWEYHLQSEVARNAWLGLYLLEKDLAEAEMLVGKGELAEDHESVVSIKKEIAEWKEKVEKAGKCPAELQTALKRAEKRGAQCTNTVGQGGQAIFREKYYIIFKKDPTEADCRLAEKLGQKAAIKKLELDSRGILDESEDSAGSSSEEASQDASSGSKTSESEKDSADSSDIPSEEEETPSRKKPLKPATVLLQKKRAAKRKAAREAKAATEKKAQSRGKEKGKDKEPSKRKRTDGDGDGRRKSPRKSKKP